MKPISEVYLGDCIEYMRKFPDKFFDLAVVDPPFGIGENWRKDRRSKHRNHRNKFNNNTPDKIYFDELFRVSKNQIIWGCNYYWNYLTPSNNLIFWDKGKDTKMQHGSAGELAWTSFSKYPLMKYDLLWNGCCVCETTEKIHPHQKPLKLYYLTFNDFAKKGDKILDTHMGSQASRIVAYKLGFDFYGSEKDIDYFNDGCKWFDKEINGSIKLSGKILTQKKLFNYEEF